MRPFVVSLCLGLSCIRRGPVAGKSRMRYTEFTEYFGSRDTIPAHFVGHPISPTSRRIFSSGRPARSRALHQPRVELAGVQPARPRSGDLGLSPAARASEVPGDRRLEP